MWFNLTNGIGDIVLQSNKHDAGLGWDLKFKEKHRKSISFFNKLNYKHLKLEDYAINSIKMLSYMI